MSASGNGPTAEDWRNLPGDDGEARPTPSLSLVVGRALGTVLVSVDGPLNLAGCQRLESLLVDLIEGQGNVAVAVDLTRASIEPEALRVFIDAAHRANLHHTRFMLKGLPPTSHEALLSRGLSESVEVTHSHVGR